MKKLLVLAIMLTVFTVPAMANDIDEVWSKADKRIGVDMPYLVQVTKNNYIGAEASKDITNGATFSDGYSGIVKWTYLGTLFGNSPWESKNE